MKSAKARYVKNYVVKNIISMDHAISLVQKKSNGEPTNAQVQVHPTEKELANASVQVHPTENEIEIIGPIHDLEWEDLYCIKYLRQMDRRCHKCKKNLLIDPQPRTIWVNISSTSEFKIPIRVCNACGLRSIRKKYYY